MLVLAAGESRRFGSPKQLVRLNGRPMLHRAVAVASQIAGNAVTVVLGAHAEQLAPLLRHSTASVLVNRHWNEGMGSSLREGVRALPSTCEAVLIMLADQPKVSAPDLGRLAAAWHNHPQSIVAASFAGRCGAPAVFPRECFSDLLQLRGDQGARNLFERYSTRLVRVPLPQAAIDIDTPEDLLLISTEGDSALDDKI